MNIFSPIHVLTICAGLTLAAASTTRVLAATPAPLDAQTLLGNLLNLAMQHNPRLAAERSRLARQQAQRDGLRGFYDPLWTVAGGRHDGFSGNPTLLPADSTTFQTDLAWAIRPGAYLNLGFSEQQFLNTVETDPLYRTLLGARVEIPLWRDRGFQAWRHQDHQAAETTWAAAYQTLAVAQEVHRDVMHAYIEWLQQQAILKAVNDALGRVLALLAETEQRIALAAAPAYQLHAARMEVALRREEQRQAVAAMTSGLARLREQVGRDIQDLMPLDHPGNLADWAHATAREPPPAHSADEAVLARGDAQAMLARLRAAQAETALAEEALRPDLALTFGVGSRSDRGDAAFDALDDADANTFGYEAAIRWRRPLGRRAEHARVAAQRAEARALGEDARALRERIERELTIARESYLAARDRLAITRDAVTEAERALQAESNRFQLGQGRNRDVLDAQNDLTNVIRREDAAAADTLRALSDWLHAAGETGPRFTQPHELLPDFTPAPSSSEP